MPDPARRQAAISIGVAEAKPLPYLGGAVNGATNFYRWAQALGYDARLVTDEQAPVTIARVCNELQALLPPQAPPVYRLAIYFAGHGVIREAEESLWLLSDWRRTLKGIAVEGLKRRLYQYGLAEIAIFADACKAVPATILELDLDEDSVLGAGPMAGTEADVAIDKFTATPAGAKTYMIPGPTPAEDLCIFSGVLLEGLWGTKATAFSRTEPSKVTSDSLAGFLKTEVPVVAGRYGLRVKPFVSPTFPPGDDIYFEYGSVPGPPPNLPGWPVPEAAPPSVQGPPQPEIGGPHAVESVTRDDDDMKVVSEAFDLEGLTIEDHLPPSAVTAFPPGTFRVESSDTPIVGYWTTGHVRHGAADTDSTSRRTFHLELEATPYPSVEPVLFEFGDGRFVATQAMSGFSCEIRHDQRRGVWSLVYHSTEGPGPRRQVQKAIRRMERGALRVDGLRDIALDLRQYKHQDPVLGVISAYLYDSIGDQQNIRRIAFYYAERGQLIPYDVALLAQLPAFRDSLGTFSMDIPAVPARPPRTALERRFEWTHEATPAISGLVGGLWPWLRQGWVFLEEPTSSEATLILSEIKDLRANLVRGRFTTLDQAGALKLAAILGLQRVALMYNEPPPRMLSVY